MERPRADPARSFALLIIAAAAAFLAALAAGHGFALIGDPPALYLLFAVLVIAGELFVLRLPSRADDVLLSASSVFAYATALLYGPGPAVLALVVATVLKGARDRRALLKTAFNAAQHALSIGLAGLAYTTLGGHVGGGIAATLPQALAGAAVYLAVNYVLTGTVVALATGTPVRRQLVGGVRVWLPLEGVMLAFAPVVALAVHRSLWMLPLLVLPLVGVVYSAQIASRADHAALHDALTGLPNRVLFRTRLEQALARTQHTGSGLIVMVLDLDSFKDVNDTLGHGRGDELLQALTERLMRALGDVDLVARLGGDEFGIVVTAGEGQQSPEVLVGRIREALALPFQLGDLWVNADASVGVAVAPDDGTDAERLIQHADVAMYQAKATGSSFARYDPASDPNRPDNLRLLQELRRGIERGELVLHYQPKVTLDTGRIVGVEALARWAHPQRGLLMPGEFIELAERSELVRALTLTVIRDAATHGVAWLERGLRLPVAVNLSPRSLLDVTLPGDIAQILRDAGLPPELLEVEVTESCLIADPDRTAQVLGRLADTGVRISIDDFGTGYSSLALLKRLPVDAVKIDRSFVRDLASDPDDQVIVTSTIGLARGLVIDVVAEGVEDAATEALLRGYGCDQAQGFHICRPLPADALDRWLQNRCEEIAGTISVAARPPQVSR